MTPAFIAWMGVLKALWTPPLKRPPTEEEAREYPYSDLVRLRDEEEARQKEESRE